MQLQHHILKCMTLKKEHECMHIYLIKQRPAPQEFSTGLETVSAPIPNQPNLKSTAKITLCASLINGF